MFDSSFPKLIQLDEVSFHSEPTIQLVHPRDISVPHVKIASEAMDYIKHVKPVPGRTIILVLAMTAGEYYGCNRNGDAWNERPLNAGGTWIGEEHVLPKHYKSFETGAHVYKHHVNKDPAKSIGGVLRAFYNWDMHRVELLLSLANGMAQDVIQEINNEKFPAVSMGCRIKEDICSICGNRAPSRVQYCDHAKYQLGQYLPNGKQVAVWNPSPKFFDISIVRRPADRIGFMMKKVAGVPEIWSSAELGEYVDNLDRKLAASRKMSYIHKMVNGGVAAAKENDGSLHITPSFIESIAKPASSATPALDDSVIRELLRHRPAEVLSTLSSMGILLTTPEFIKFFAWKVDPSLQIPEGVLSRAVQVQQQVFDILAQNPDLVESIERSEFVSTGPENVNPALVATLSSLLEKRSYANYYLQNRLVDQALSKISELKPGQGYLDVLETVDPATGQRFKTNRKAVQAAKRHTPAIYEAPARNILGSGALLASAYKAFGAVPPRMSPERELALHRPWGASYTTTSGEHIPSGTELVAASPYELDKRAALSIAQDWSTVAQEKNAKTAVPHSINSSVASFDEVATWLGKVICS